jgi:hypothetical protein
MFICAVDLFCHCRSALTTTAGRATPFTLLVALCPGGQAFGSLFWDDGMELEHTNYLTVEYHAQLVGEGVTGGVFTASITHNTFAEANQFNVDKIIVMGPKLTTPTLGSTLNGRFLTKENVQFDIEKKSLTFSNLGLTLDHSIALTWN